MRLVPIELFTPLGAFVATAALTIGPTRNRLTAAALLPLPEPQQLSRLAYPLPFSLSALYC